MEVFKNRGFSQSSSTQRTRRDFRWKARWWSQRAAGGAGRRAARFLWPCQYGLFMMCLNCHFKIVKTWEVLWMIALIDLGLFAILYREVLTGRWKISQLKKLNGGFFPLPCFVIRKDKYERTSVHTCKYANMHACKHANMHTYIHAYMHACTHTHIYIYSIV